MTCELCNRHARIGRKRILKFRRGRGIIDPLLGGEFLARVDKGVIRFTWDFHLCDQCDRTRLYYIVPISDMLGRSPAGFPIYLCDTLSFGWDKPGVVDHCRWIAEQLCKLVA